MTNGPVIERALAESFRAAMERGRIALFSAPCGFGKTVVSRALLARCGVTLSDTELTAVLRDTSGHPLERATLFALRPVRPEDGAFLDAYKRPVPVTQVIEPKAVIRGGRLSNCRQAIKEGPYGGDSNPGRAGIPDRAG